MAFGLPRSVNVDEMSDEEIQIVANDQVAFGLIFDVADSDRNWSEERTRFTAGLEQRHPQMRCGDRVGEGVSLNVFSIMVASLQEYLRVRASDEGRIEHGSGDYQSMTDEMQRDLIACGLTTDETLFYLTIASVTADAWKIALDTSIESTRRITSAAAFEQRRLVRDARQRGAL